MDMLNMNGQAQGLSIRKERRFRGRSPFTWNLVKAPDNVNAPESVYAARTLPVSSIDLNTDDAIVIPQGVIVALKSVHTVNFYKNVITDGDAELGITASGTIVGGVDAYNNSLSYSVTDEETGYGQQQVAVLTIANGGVATKDVYTSLDEEMEIVNASGVAVSAGDTVTRVANIPYGVTAMPVFQDYRGKYLNSSGPSQQLDAPLIKTYIHVPYVIDTNTYTYGFREVTVSGGDKSNVATATNHKGYNAVLGKCGFLYTGARGGKANGSVDEAFFNCEYLVSDANGRFVPQSAAGALTAQKTAQTVGRLICLDSKWPKALSELEDTYEGSGMTGTDTRGIDKFIYEFVADILKANSASYDRNSVYNAIQSGRFGMATIEILPA